MNTGKLWLAAMVGAVTFGVSAEVLFEVKTLKDVENKRPLEKKDDGSILVKKAAWVVGKVPLPADPQKRYRISCEVKAAGDGPVKGVRIGVSPRNAQKKGANISGILPIKGTETTVVSPVKKEDKRIVVKDASKWQKNVPTRIVYDADPDGSMRDIPNFDFVGGRPAGWEKEGGNWVIQLVRPAGVELSAGTVIRQHQDSRNAIFSNAHIISGPEWKTIEFVIGPGLTMDGRASNKLFPGVAFVSPLLAVPGNILIRNLKIEVLE